MSEMQEQWPGGVGHSRNQMPQMWYALLTPNAGEMEGEITVLVRMEPQLTPECRQTSNSLNKLAENTIGDAETVISSSSWEDTFS